MKKALNKLVLFLIGLLIAITPFGIFYIIASNQPHIYSKTYYAALVDKINYLDSAKNQKKIILVGGSNVAFGFDSKLIEQEFPEYKVVNFGLYAMLGTKIMMDYALDAINEGDLVFVIPEINSQSTSLYFSGDATLKAIEDNMNLVWRLPKNNQDVVIGNYFNFVNERDKFDKIIEPTGVYQRKNFNNYGDIAYSDRDENGIPFRSVNRMAIHYDPTMMVDYSYDIDQSFLDYLNQYNDKVLDKNATLYYAFSPVNELAVLNKEDAVNYYWQLRQGLQCKVIGNPLDYIIDAHYFYDSNFHLNDSGSILRTYYFVEDLYREVFLESKKPSFDKPDMPLYIDENVLGEDSETAPYFNYVEYEDSLLISSVVNEHLADENIVLPSVANGKKVVGIDKDAFKGTVNLDNLIIPKTINILMDGCFGNSPITKIYIETYNPSDIIVSYTGSMTDGVTLGFKIYIHTEAYTSFTTDYYWGAYTEYFARY